MKHRSSAGVNRRWRRADLELSPRALLVIAAIVALILIIAAVSS